MSSLQKLIVGAGPAGNAMAFWLAKLGHSVTVVERWPELRVTGLQLDLRGPGIEVVRRMGLEQPVRECCVPEEGFALADAAGRRHAFFPANRSGKGPQSITSEFEIMRGDLCRVLHDAAVRRGARYRFGITVDGLTERNDGTVEARLSDGATERFDLVIGCDGQGSRVRRLMLAAAAGGQAPLKPDGADGSLHTLPQRIAYFTMARPRQQGERYIATMYNIPQRRTMLIRRHREDSVQVYLTARAGPGPAQIRDPPQRGDVAAEKAAFADAFAGQGLLTDEAVKALREAADDFYCQYSGYVKMGAWSRGRITLVGDAAHGTPPNGFGTSAALIGAYVLAGEISTRCPAGEGATKSDGLQAALQAYEDKMKPLIVPQQHDPSLLDKIPSTALTVAIANRLVGLVAFLRLDKLLMKFAPEGLGGRWDIPVYEDMVKN